MACGHRGARIDRAQCTWWRGAGGADDLEQASPASAGSEKPKVHPPLWDGRAHERNHFPQGMCPEQGQALILCLFEMANLEDA